PLLVHSIPARDGRPRAIERPGGHQLARSDRKVPLRWNCARTASREESVLFVPGTNRGIESPSWPDAPMRITVACARATSIVVRDHRSGRRMFLVGKRAAKFLTRRNSSLYPNATATHRKVSESCGPHGTQPERGSQQLDLAIR